MSEQITGQGASRMIRPRGEAIARRTAQATALVRMSEQTVELIRRGGVAAGNVIEVARIAAIAAAKQTATMIPLCRAIRLDAVEVEFRPDDSGILVCATIEATDRRGAETEALAAACVAAITMCDMCRPFDAQMCIGEVRVTAPSAGRGVDKSPSDEPGRSSKPAPVRLRRGSQRRARGKRHKTRSHKGKP